MTRQQIWARKMRAQGRCTTCGDEAALVRMKNGKRKRLRQCAKHLKRSREKARREKGAKRRNLNAASYLTNVKT